MQHVMQCIHQDCEQLRRHQYMSPLTWRRLMRCNSVGTDDCVLARRGRRVRGRVRRRGRGRIQQVHNWRTVACGLFAIGFKHPGKQKDTTRGKYVDRKSCFSDSRMLFSFYPPRPLASRRVEAFKQTLQSLKPPTQLLGGGFP